MEKSPIKFKSLISTWADDVSLRTLVDGGAGELIAHRALKIGLHLCFQLLMVLTLSALCMVSDRGDVVVIMVIDVVTKVLTMV